MKAILITLLASLLVITGFCQAPEYRIGARDSRPLTKETISRSNTLEDLIPGYPQNWISSYVSVEISATSFDGNVRKATGPTNFLTTEQKNILAAVELGAVVTVDVNYKYDDLTTIHAEPRQIHVSMTVFPEIQAQYIGGHEEMDKYLKKNVADKISNKSPKKLQEGTVIFTVNEAGEIVNAKISRSSGDSQTDKLFVEAINKMPKWKPAQNSKGEKVKQGFVFDLGMGGC